jgi:hypothetical protein
MNKINIALLLVLVNGLTACAQLHHLQVGDIDNREASKSKAIPVEVKVREIGFDADEAVGIARAFSSNDESRDELQDLQTLLALVQMGPKTGRRVYVEGYADNILSSLLKKCPSGRLTDLRSARESIAGPAISGEYVVVKGMCIAS